MYIHGKCGIYQFEIDKGMTTMTSEICRIERCTATINYLISVMCFWFFGNVENYVGLDSYCLLFVQIKSNIWSLEFCFCIYLVITFACMWMDVEWILELGSMWMDVDGCRMDTRIWQLAALFHYCSSFAMQHSPLCSFNSVLCSRTDLVHFAMQFQLQFNAFYSLCSAIWRN